MIHVRKNTGFICLIISLRSVIGIYNNYYKKFHGFLLTYKLSQDHLEVYFSAVRSKSGHSNNPTCFQFINIFKKLLVHADVKGSEHANCLCLDDTQILHLKCNGIEYLEEIMNNDFNDFTNDDSNEEVFVENENFYGPGVNKTYVNHVVEYLAGFLTRVILKKLRCDYCPLLLTNETSQSALLNKKKIEVA